MSRMGKKPIALDPKVKAEIKDSVITVTGPKGSESFPIPECITVEITEKEILVKKADENDNNRFTRMKHGMVRSIVNSMVIGVSEGFKIELEFFGVGYRAAIQGNKLTMNLGYSNPRIYEVPANVTATMRDQTHLTLESTNKQAVGQAAADIRANRFPDAYHGKGVRFLGEQLSLKEGKKV